MNSVARLKFEQLRTAAFRKEAEAGVLETIARGAHSLAKGVGTHVAAPVGHATWEGAKAIGGGHAMGGAAVLGGSTLAAGATVPALAQQGKQTYDVLKDPRAARAAGGT